MTPVLFVDHAAALGGAEHSLLLLLDHLDRTAWQPHLACVPGQLAKKAIISGIPCHLMNLPQLRRSPRFMADWAKSARQLARLALCLSAAQVIANSHIVAQQLPCTGKTAVVHNGIDVDKFDPRLDGRPFRVQHAIPHDVPVVGMVGRLRPWKGQLAFLQMAARIVKQHPDTHFVVVGGANFAVADDYPRQIEQLTQNLGLTERVIFTGMVDNVSLPLAAMDIFVHPGEPEPFGLVNIEAMAMARPVVAFQHGALPEIVEEGMTGLLVPPGEILALAEAVISLLNDTQKREQMGQHGRIRAETHFTIQRTSQEVSRIMCHVT